MHPQRSPLRLRQQYQKRPRAKIFVQIDVWPHLAHPAAVGTGGRQLRGRTSQAYRLRAGDRPALQAVLGDGQLIQRVANRARALWALERGARLGDTAHWLGWSRMGRWYGWPRYEPYGVDAVFDAERSGRPPVFPPTRTCPDCTRRLHRSRRRWLAPGPMGWPPLAASPRGAGGRRPPWMNAS
jgi:hypothetical protein